MDGTWIIEMPVESGSHEKVAIEIISGSTLARYNIAVAHVRCVYRSRMRAKCGYLTQ